jgi:hypothetical protein
MAAYAILAAVLAILAIRASGVVKVQHRWGWTYRRGDREIRGGPMFRDEPADADGAREGGET